MATNLGNFLSSVATLLALFLPSPHVLYPSAAATFISNYTNLVGSNTDIYTTLPTFVGLLAKFILDDVPERVGGLSQFERLTMISNAPAGATLNADGTVDGNGGVFVRRTVDEILFGYSKAAPDPLTRFAGIPANGFFGPRYTNASDYVAQYAAQYASAPKGGTIVPTVVASGLGGVQAPGQLITAGGLQTIITRHDLNQPCPAPPADCRIWLQPEVITGAYDGAAFSALHQNDAVFPSIPVFDGGVTMRSIKFVPAAPTPHATLKQIAVRRYVLDPTQMLNASNAPTSANADYRMVEGDGIVPLAAVNQGAPIYLSLPHFTGADPTLVQAKVQGLTPAASATQAEGPYLTFLDVDPISGRTMQAFKRLQLNIGLKASMLNRPDITGTYLAGGDVIMPVLWVEESGTISDADAAAYVSAINVRAKFRAVVCGRCVYHHSKACDFPCLDRTPTAMYLTFFTLIAPLPQLLAHALLSGCPALYSCPSTSGGSCPSCFSLSAARCCSAAAACSARARSSSRATPTRSPRSRCRKWFRPARRRSCRDSAARPAAAMAATWDSRNASRRRGVATC